MFGLSSLTWKLIGAGLLIAGVLFVVKRYGDAKIAEGIYKERIRQGDTLAAELVKGQKLILADTAALKAVNENNVTASLASEKRIIGEIDSLEKQLVSKLAQLARVRTERDEEIDRIPASDLPNEIRNQSRKLADQPQPPDD